MDEKKHGLQLTGNQLKIIAIAAMTLDHCVAVFMPQDMAGRWILRMLGRMAAPIMCYLIAEGYHHTSNLKKYMGRLLLVAVISHIPYNLCFGYDVWRFWEATDVMVALFAGLTALAAFEKRASSVAAPVYCGRLLSFFLFCELELYCGAVDSGIRRFLRQCADADGFLCSGGLPVSSSALYLWNDPVLYVLYQAFRRLFGNSSAALLQRQTGPPKPAA